MNFEAYINHLSGRNISAVKRKILLRLWEEGTRFPRGWVKSEELLSRTGQKYFDRRVRELRDEVGCDIETGRFDGEHAYRLLSTTVVAGKPRGYLATTEKAELFRAADNRCAVCAGQFSAGVRGLQADHKIPLVRGGLHDPSNWQPLCVECNVGKRWACSSCLIDCQVCPWAFPERVGHRLIVQIPRQVEYSLKALSQASGKSLSACVAEAVAQYVIER